MFPISNQRTLISVVWRWIWEHCTLLHLTLPSTDCLQEFQGFSAPQCWHLTVGDAWVLLSIHWQNSRLCSQSKFPSPSLPPKPFPCRLCNSAHPHCPWQISNSSSCYNRVHGGERTHKYLGLTTVLNIWIPLWVWWEGRQLISMATDGKVSQRFFQAISEAAPLVKQLV